jgi:hypothetical protein
MKEFNLPKIFNWQKASEKIVKKYVAQLSQSGTAAPVATELYNDTGVAFTFLYGDPGEYAIVASKDIFMGDGKTQIEFTNPVVTPDIFTAAIPFPITNDMALLYSIDNGSGANNILGNPFYPQTTIVITMYN